MRKASLLLASSCLLVSCQAALYDLPSPPPPAERKSVSLIPGEEQRRAEELALDARAKILELNNLLATQQYEEAVANLSLETRDFLVSMGGGASATEVLASGKLKLRNGEVVDFDPVTMLIAEDVSKLSDSVKGIEEHETGARKEIFATLPSGKIQKVVLIAEGGKWVLHRTQIPEPFDPPAK